MVAREINPPRRLWLVCFEPGNGAWWQRYLKPGFGHVSAAAYFADAERWVHFNPTLRGTVIEVWEPPRFERRLQQLMRDSTAILRVPSKFDRRCAPLSPWCVGALKGLLGYPSRALTPFGLYRALIAAGAEIVDVPCVAAPNEAAAPSAHGEPVFEP